MFEAITANMIELWSKNHTGLEPTYAIERSNQSRVVAGIVRVDHSVPKIPERFPCRQFEFLAGQRGSPKVGAWCLGASPFGSLNQPLVVVLRQSNSQPSVAGDPRSLR
jgi:hypothetical protein